MQTTDLLNERQTTHGSFEMNAIVAQRLRALFRECTSWHALPDVQKESLDMIATKVSRILSGQGDFVGHWEDVEGYAALARKACTR